MLEQLGLKANTKEGKEMLGVLKAKMGSKEQEDQGLQQASEGEEQEYDDGKLTLGDLFSSIDKSK
jgi:hypothetical protein